MFDPSQYDTKGPAEAGAFCHLRDPRNASVLLMDGETPVGITMAGEESDRVRRVERAAFDRRMEVAQLGQGAAMKFDTLEADNLEKLVAAAISWSGLEGSAGKFSPVTVRKFFEMYPAFREQVQTFYRNRANFPAAPPKS